MLVFAHSLYVIVCFLPVRLAFQRQPWLVCRWGRRGGRLAFSRSTRWTLWGPHGLDSTILTNSAMACKDWLTVDKSFWYKSEWRRILWLGILDGTRRSRSRELRFLIWLGKSLSLNVRDPLRPATCIWHVIFCEEWFRTTRNSGTLSSSSRLLLLWSYPRFISEDQRSCGLVLMGILVVSYLGMDKFGDECGRKCQVDIFMRDWTASRPKTEGAKKYHTLTLLRPWFPNTSSRATVPLHSSRCLASARLVDIVIAIHRLHVYLDMCLRKWTTKRHFLNEIGNTLLGQDMQY